MGAKGVVAGLFGLVLIFGACSEGDDEPARAASAKPATPTTKAPPAYTPAASAPVSRGVATVRITRVIDGDTFEIDGGVHVRPLGIDSCEMSTPGGKDAKHFAEAMLGSSGNTVTLTMEPGIDLDQHGRQLRYVTMYNGSDFGKAMVTYDHTAVYAGHNDASSTYVAELRQLDTNGRNCAGPPPVPTTENHYVPTPNGNEDDHHKSRFCGRHWYC